MTSKSKTTTTPQPLQYPLVEPFSKTRYQAYTSRGIPFRVVNGRGQLCEVKAFDSGKGKDQVLVEYTYEYLGKKYVSSYYASQRNGSYPGTRDTDFKLFIYRGPWFEHNDLVVRTLPDTFGREIFFWRGLRPADKLFLAKCIISSPYADLHDSDFAQCILGCDVKDYKNYIFRLATDEDIADYRKELRHHRVAWEDDGRSYYYPHVGDHYYEIFFNHGVADFRELVLESEDARPEISRLIMRCDIQCSQKFREQRVRHRVDEINKALGLIE